MYNIIRLENLLHSTSRRIVDRAIDNTDKKRLDIDLFDNIRSEFQRANSLKQIDKIMRITIDNAWSEAISPLSASKKDEEEDDEYINLILFGLLYATSYYANFAAEYSVKMLNQYELSPTNVNNLKRISASKLGMYSRTFVNDVYSTTQYYCYKNAEVEYVEFSAVIDERTSTICRMMDGTVFSIDSPEALEYKPPLHNNCRSRLIDAGTKFNNNRLFNNRDFTKPNKGKEMEYSLVEKNFRYIDNFRANWNLPETVIEESLMSIGLI